MKSANIFLSVLCIVLTIALLFSISGGSRTPASDAPDVGVYFSSDPGTDTVIGLPSGAEFSDYTVAKNYGEIYDYVKNQYGDSSSIFSGLTEIYKEEATADGAATDAATNSSVDTGGALFSSTNIMTQGVDESDISKTDGDYIYNVTNSEIIIYDIREGLPVLCSSFAPAFLAPSDIIREIYLDGDILTVITEHSDFSSRPAKDMTNVLIYDIKDRTSPSLTGSYKQDGAYQTSRKVDDIIYLFTNMYLPDPGSNRALKTNEDELSSWFPTINEKIVSSDCIYLPEQGLNSFIISSFNQGAPEDTIDTKIIINDYVETYMGDDSIYLYSSVYSGNRQILKLSKLSYSGGLITPGKSTTIRGMISDKFAINESPDGYLRVIATEWDPSITNTLYIFDENLTETGHISNIANSEQLYAARFLGDTVYFVTFERTDPLFTADLSDPYAPEIIGELELPGFSEYLHFWNDKKLLGIGYDTDDSGRQTGLKLSMFDISNKVDVREESKLVIKGDYSPGFYDYKAILAFPEGNIFGFSYTDYDTNRSGYAFYEYENGEFNKLFETPLNEQEVYRVRGHFANDYLYVSKEIEVIAEKRQAD